MSRYFLAQSHPSRAEFPSEIASEIINLLKSRSQTLAVAESHTGGEIISTLASVPGASSVLLGGVVSCRPGFKISLLGVDRQLVYRVGHPEGAVQMARGVRRVASGGSGSDQREEEGMASWGLCCTGAPGPD